MAPPDSLPLDPNSAGSAIDTRGATDTPPTLPPHISLDNDLVGFSPTRISDAIHQALSLSSDLLTSVDNPTSTATMEQLRGEIDNVDLNQPLGSLRSTLTELQHLWLDHAVWYHHPRYIAHLNCPISSSAVAADTLATIVNTAVESWDQAGPAALIEQKVLRWVGALAGWEGHTNGTFTSGGTQSNLHAMLVARNKARSRADDSSLRVYCTAATHYSIRRACHILGLSDHAVVIIPTDSNHRMIPAELDRALATAEQEGLTPMAIATTAGTTDAGAIDPLADIAQLAARYRTHLHVDAAYGGALLASPTRRHLLEGVEHADSLTIDFHKSFFQPVACSAVVFRTGADLRHSSWHADYLNPGDSPELNLADYSLQTTRRFDAAKIWVTLRTHGASALGESFDRCCDLARTVAKHIATRPGFTVLTTPQLSTVVFRFTDPDAPTPQQVRQRLLSTGTAVIATTVIDNEPWMKFTILDPTLSLGDVYDILAAIDNVANLTGAHHD